MPDPAPLDIDSLLLPISGERAAGDRNAYPYRLREKLSNLRVAERAEDFDDATRPEQLKQADYPAIVQLATEALTTQTKDLRLVCHLIEALTKTRGFAGLRDGLCLLKRLLQECWNRMEPDIDDGDLDSRAAPIANLLDDPDRGFCFPNTVRATPLITGQSVLSWQKLYTKRDADAEKEIARAQATATLEIVQVQKANIDAALTELEALCQVMDECLKDNSPSLSNLRKAMEEALLMAAAFLPKQVAATPATQAANETQSHPVEAPHAGPALNVNQIMGARDEVYAQLTQAAATLAQLEPHSPIPYLVRRAVELGKLPFPQLVQQLVREERILTDLQREFGLQQALST